MIRHYSTCCHLELQQRSVEFTQVFEQPEHLRIGLFECMPLVESRLAGSVQVSSTGCLGLDGTDPIPSGGLEFSLKKESPATIATSDSVAVSSPSVSGALNILGGPMAVSGTPNSSIQMAPAMNGGSFAGHIPTDNEVCLLDLLGTIDDNSPTVQPITVETQNQEISKNINI
ncbi:unnamed protein product, partial [Protopolystoma xenopodis]